MLYLLCHSQSTTYKRGAGVGIVILRHAGLSHADRSSLYHPFIPLDSVARGLMSYWHVSRDRQIRLSASNGITLQDMTKQQQMHLLCLWSQMITNNEASNFVESRFHSSSETAQCLIPWHNLQPITISMWLLQITWHFWESCNSLCISQSQIPIWKVHYAYLHIHSASHNRSNWLQNLALHPSLNTWLWWGRVLP